MIQPSRNPHSSETLISIVIPAYNVGQKLGATIESVLAQTHKNIELIIVNDGSKDGTAKVMEHYAALDPRVKTIHKENGGVTSARLAGVRAANGQWIGFVDGDDQIDPEMYSHLLNNAVDCNADISHCGYQMIFPDRKDYYYNTGCLKEQNHETALTDLISGEFVEPTLCSKLYKRTLFDRLLSDNLMDPSIRNFEDLLMNYFLFREADKAVFEDICLYHYIVHPNSAANSTQSSHKLLGPLQVFRIIEKDVSSDPRLLSQIQSRIASYLITLSTLPAITSPHLIKPIRANSRRELRSMLPDIKKNPVCSKKLYLMALWAGYLPRSYQFVHWLHGEITGNSKKYEVK